MGSKSLRPLQKFFFFNNNNNKSIIIIIIIELDNHKYNIFINKISYFIE